MWKDLGFITIANALYCRSILEDVSYAGGGEVLYPYDVKRTATEEFDQRNIAHRDAVNRRGFDSTRLSGGESRVWTV